MRANFSGKLRVAVVVLGAALLLMAAATSNYRHHQPNIGDLPTGVVEHEGSVSPGDRALDRQLNICRRC